MGTLKILIAILLAAALAVGAGAGFAQDKRQDGFDSEGGLGTTRVLDVVLFDALVDGMPTYTIDQTIVPRNESFPVELAICADPAALEASGAQVIVTGPELKSKGTFFLGPLIGTLRQSQSRSARCAFTKV